MPDFTQFINYFNDYPNIPLCDSGVFHRLADTTWRLLTTAEKDGNGAKSTSAAASVCPSIVIGRLLVTTEDRWRIQANMRREEAKAGVGRKQYNRKVTRATKTTKGPAVGEGFPPGRGRPV